MTALITGASSGLGVAYAHHLADRGKNLVLVARRKDALDALAERLRATQGVDVVTVASDLSRPEAAAELAAEVERIGTTIDVLVNNAGFGLHGDVVSADPAVLTNMIDLNCRTVVDLCSRFVPAMVERGEGTVINIASTAAFQPVPHMAVYGATKAFVLNYTEALWSEVRDRGVRVIAVAPGATATEFFERAGEGARAGSVRTPDQVMRATERGLRRGDPVVVDGGMNTIMAGAASLMPRRVTMAVVDRMMRGR